MIRWMCSVKLKGLTILSELRQWLEIEDIVKVVQRNRLQWYGHVFRTDDDDWVKSGICWRSRKQD